MGIRIVYKDGIVLDEEHLMALKEGETLEIEPDQIEVIIFDDLIARGELNIDD